MVGGTSFLRKLTQEQMRATRRTALESEKAATHTRSSGSVVVAGVFLGGHEENIMAFYYLSGLHLA